MKGNSGDQLQITQVAIYKKEDLVSKYSSYRVHTEIQYNYKNELEADSLPLSC